MLIQYLTYLLAVANLSVLGAAFRTQAPCAMFDWVHSECNSGTNKYYYSEIYY